MSRAASQPLRLWQHSWPGPGQGSLVRGLPGHGPRSPITWQVWHRDPAGLVAYSHILEGGPACGIPGFP